MTKQSVIKWLEAQQEKYQGRYMDAEEKDQHEKMEAASETEEILGEMIGFLENL